MIIVTILPLLWLVAMARLPFQAGSDSKDPNDEFLLCMSVHQVWVEHSAVSPDTVNTVNKSSVFKSGVWATMAKNGNALGIPVGHMVSWHLSC